MLTKATLHIVFPRTEFNKLMAEFLHVSSIRHQTNGDLLYLGDARSVQKVSPDKLSIVLDIRKDETPCWYVKDIVSKALKEEILIAKDSQILCKGGKILKVEGLEGHSDDDIIEPLEAMILPKKGKR